MNIAPEKIAPPVAFVVVGLILVVLGSTGVVPFGNPQPQIQNPVVQNIFLYLGFVFILIGPLFVVREIRANKETKNSNLGTSKPMVKITKIDGDGHLTGTWEQIIFKGITKEIIKKDIVNCRHIGELVEADITRVFPEDQKGRKWYFNGRFRKDRVFGHFWSDEKAAFSFGTIYLREVGKDTLRGNYVRAHQYNQSWKTDRLDIQTIRLQWEKK